MAFNWSEHLGTAVALVRNNPALVGTVALGTSGLAVFAAPVIAITPIVGALHYVGFGVGGIVGGS